ncbi:MAG: DNA-formamidopyrimidine glycosylase family protein [Solirubrobacterales bacterium]
MAEGDTILRLSRRIDAALAGQAIATSAPNPRGRAAGVERLDGRRLDGAEARGKHLLLHFGDLVLHSHLGMSGSWHVYRRAAAWRRPRSSAWAVLAGEQQEAVQFGGPALRLLSAERLRRDPQLARLGPDILAPDFDPAPVVASLRAEPTRGVGDALLDQSLVAGIGNIFKSEGCFAARVDPWRAIGDLGDEELRAVLEATRKEMQEAAASGRHNPAVYRRHGPCRCCGGRVASRGQGDANRTTYWCPDCQR